MANYRHMRPGFGSWADQLSITGSSSSTSEDLGWEAAPSSSSSSSSSIDYGAIAQAGIVTAGRVASSVWGYHQPDPATPVYPGYTPPAGSVTGSLSGVNVNVLLLVGLGALGILMFAGRKAA